MYNNQEILYAIMECLWWYSTKYFIIFLIADGKNNFSCVLTQKIKNVWPIKTCCAVFKQATARILASLV